jgi:hypothetical protein
MRRIILLVGVALVALGATGIAVAKLEATGVSPATATFSASVDGAKTSTCTGGGDTYRLTKGRYVGKLDFAAPNDDLDGTLVLWLEATYNQTDKVGWVEGTFRTRDDDRRPSGRLYGTLGEPGGQLTLDGLVNGAVDRRHGRLLGGVSAALKANETGLITLVEGSLGTGGPSLPAVLAGRPCSDEKPGPVTVRLTVHGTITAVSAESVTVTPTGSAPQTCVVKAGTSPSTSGFAAGQRVEMGCGLVDGKWTLLKLKRKG